MAAKNNETLIHALDRYFAIFESAQSLAAQLIEERRYPTEILVVLCTRLDALATESTAEGTSTRKAFGSFVARYGGDRNLFDSISLGDLYYELAFHRWLLEGMIPMPGRLQRFSQIDTPIIQLLEGAGLPLTLHDSEALLDTLMRILRQRFHVKPRQPRTKRSLVTAAGLKREVMDAFQGTRLRSVANSIPGALDPLLETKRVSNILYRRFRCESVHGAAVRLDETRFFTSDDIYWKALYSEYYGAFELIEFPAKFLLSLLDRCIRTYRAHLVATGKLPPDVHFQAFPDGVLEELDLLDESLLPEQRQVRFRTD